MIEKAKIFKWSRYLLSLQFVQHPFSLHLLHPPPVLRSWSDVGKHFSGIHDDWCHLPRYKTQQLWREQPRNIKKWNRWGISSKNCRWGWLSFLHKGDELSKYEPNVHQTNVGSGRKPPHHTGREDNICYEQLNMICIGNSSAIQRMMILPNLTKSVVVTSITVRFTVTAASK